MAAKTTNRNRMRFGNSLKTKTCRIFARYSKNSDQAGPFNGNISVQPRISIEGVTGMSARPRTVIPTSCQTEVSAIFGKIEDS